MIAEYPLYTKEDIKLLWIRIRKLLENDSGFEIFNRFMQSRLHPSKKLLENVHMII
jgi:hypothetical protein